MKLAWLAAVLQPRDVAPHPNFPDDAYDREGPPRLAAVVMGDQWRGRRATELAGEISDDDLIVLAERCLRPETIAVSVVTLSRWLTGPRPDDLAQAAALTLIACSAAAELDDYETCLQVLDAQLRWTSDLGAPDDLLLRAALLQQRALRLCDAGQSPEAALVETAAVLSRLDTGACTAFATSPGISWSSRTTIEQIRANILSAAASLFPAESEVASEAAGLPTWQERVRSPLPSIAVRTSTERADTYATFVAELFARQFRSQSRNIGGGPVRPDLFYSVLALELLGHGDVYAARKELALLRLVQAGGGATETADALRLLRHAAAKNELDLALHQLRAAGPLSVLSHDARQVIRTRTTPRLLRTVELRVLRVAAELLAPAEARVALDAVRAALEAGGPPNLPRTWELLLLRKEVAWAAAAALGNACGAAGEVAELLLDEASKASRDDQLLDRSLMRAAAEVAWTDVPPRVRQAWAEFLDSRAEGLAGTAEVVFPAMDRPIPATVPRSPMDTVVDGLNAALRGGPVDHDLADGVPLVREALRKIRADAAHGSYSMGGVSIGDIAAGLVVVVGGDELWSELTEFLLDPAVHQEDRTPPFDRLARADLVLPPGVATRFRDQAQRLLVTTRLDPFERPQVVPYPAALRFLGSHRLLDDAEVYEGIATLAGSSAAARREAAVTVAALAATAPRSELLALVLPLARDDDVEVRANAGGALATLVRPDEPLAAVANRRLAELLAEDGLLSPRRVLRALAAVSGRLPEAVLHQIEELAEQHPSRYVRTEAGRLLVPQDPSERGAPLGGQQ